MNFDTKEDKLKYFIDYLESQDTLVDRVDDIEQVPGFGEVHCLITASRIESFEGDQASQEKAAHILETSGTVALINEMKNSDLKITPLFVSEIMVYSMTDDEGEYFALKTVAQLSTTPEYEQILHRGTMDMDSPKEEFIAFVADSVDAIKELQTNMDNFEEKK